MSCNQCSRCGGCHRNPDDIRQEIIDLFSARRNPGGLNFMMDYNIMIDALDQALPDWEAQIPALRTLYHQLDQATHRLTVAEFSDILGQTICPQGTDPTYTEVYQAAIEARNSPAQPRFAKLLLFIEKLRHIIRIFDRNHLKSGYQLSLAVTAMRSFVKELLDRINQEQPSLQGRTIDALSNLERWKSSLQLLDPYTLNLHSLNSFIEVLQPTQPFAESVFLLYAVLDDDQIGHAKGMEFMELISQISDIINPFTHEIAANEELTGWRYLHVPA